MEKGRRRVTFVIDYLPFEGSTDGGQDDVPGSDGGQDHAPPLEVHPFSLEYFSASYHHVLAAILGSPLNRAGMIESVYVNFRDNRWFKHKEPETDFFDDVTPGGFQTIVQHLLTPNLNYGRRLKWEESGSGIARVLERLLSAKTTTHVIGCVSGDDGVSLTHNNFIDSVKDDDTCVFVIGCFKEGDVKDSITETINVSSYPVNPETCVSYICSALESKWDIN